MLILQNIYHRISEEFLSNSLIYELFRGSCIWIHLNVYYDNGYYCKHDVYAMLSFQIQFLLCNRYLFKLKKYGNNNTKNFDFFFPESKNSISKCFYGSRITFISRLKKRIIFFQ